MDVSKLQQMQKFKLSNVLKRASDLLNIYAQKNLLNQTISSDELKKLSDTINEFNQRHLI